MFKRVFLLLFFIVFSTYWSSYAQNLDPSYKISQIILNKVEKKYPNSVENRLIFLWKINNLISKYLEKNKISENKSKKLEWIVLYFNEYIFASQMRTKKEEQFLFYKNIPAVNDFDIVAKNKENLFLESWSWYTYNFTQSNYFPNNSDITVRNLEKNNLPLSSTLLTVEKNQQRAVMVPSINYKKQFLIEDTVIFWIPDKYLFLTRLKKDIYLQPNSNSSLILKSIQHKTLWLTKGKTKQQKIEILYNYVISNIEYSSDLSGKDIYSAIETFKNNDGVCEWYAGLFQYMLAFAGISDVEFIPWDVIDSKDFPDIWHAWIRIGDRYFDPTFDDPTGLEETRNKSEYRYFSLPKDIFYTNRYNLNTTPDTLKLKPLSYRESLVKQNLAVLTKKYPENKYNLLKEFEFRNSHGLNQFERLELKKLEKIFPSFLEVDNYKILNNSDKKYISDITYFVLKSSQDVDNLLFQLNYDITGYQLFKWKIAENKYQYRISNEFALK